ncbi:unnamed protein product [Polarella glacialis]|uniref:Serpin domain-containing protein n=1 Tax=Polarella glacialis TaxID=89957 RepID=A0A813I369_POLGL|nr:unnamed protein product [Polarella glacialis]
MGSTDSRASSEAPPTASQAMATSPAATTQREKLNTFGLGLFQRLNAGGNASADVVISPLSLSVCLSMVAAGATEGSPTEKEMSAVLGAAALALPPGCPLEVANSAWLRGEIKADYVRSIEANFGADARTLPGVDPAPINAWVRERTKVRISSLFPAPLDPLTVMVLVNTVFFKGDWQEPFDPQKTRPASFRPFTGAPIPCEMMHQKDTHMLYIDSPFAKGVQLPYSSGGLLATILLPVKEGPEALEHLIATLSPQIWDAMLGKVKRQHVELHLPRFKVEFGAGLEEQLKALGMPTAFEGELPSGAFRRMTDDPLVHLSTVIHRATVEVNEAGTVASAATGAVMKTRCIPPPAVPIVVDRPFLFMITASDGALFFLAKAVSPTLSGIGATIS